MSGVKSILPPNIRLSGLKITTSAPGKVILYGEHSVLYGKLALTASLGMGSLVRLMETTSPNLIFIQVPALDLASTCNLEKMKEYLLDPLLPLTHTTSEFNWEYPEFIHQDAVTDLADNLINHTTGTGNLTVRQRMMLSSIYFLVAGILGSVNIDLHSFLITCTTGLSIGAGIGSSVSFLVSFAAALVQYVKLRCGGKGNISKEGYRPCVFDNADGGGFTKRELDMICKWAFCAEKIIHSTPSGVDNTICTYGGIVEFRKGLAPKLLEISRPLRILLIYTKVQRETKKLVSKVAALHNQYPDLVNNILNAMEDVSFIALQHLTSLCFSTAPTEETDDTIRHHYEELGRLASINQGLLSALGVSHLKLDEAIQILAENGLQGKLTGAGGGGYAFCIVPPYVSDMTVRDLSGVFLSRGFHAVLTQLGGKGVAVE